MVPWNWRDYGHRWSCIGQISIVRTLLIFALASASGRTKSNVERFNTYLKGSSRRAAGSHPRGQRVKAVGRSGLPGRLALADHGHCCFPASTLARASLRMARQSAGVSALSAPFRPSRSLASSCSSACASRYDIL